MNLRKLGGWLAAVSVALITSAGATVTVNTTADVGDGVCDATECTLREAVSAAASGETIEFSVTGTITLVGTITIDKSLVIQGPAAGSSGITIDGGYDGNPESGTGVQLIKIAPGAFNVSLSNLTFSRGVANPGGGAIENASASELTITNCTFTDNAALAPSTVPRTGSGGAILQRAGSLIVKGSAFRRNTVAALSGGRTGQGGAIYNEGATSVDIQDTEFTDNVIATPTSGFGGAVANIVGSLLLKSTVFTGNRCITGNSLGGAVYVSSYDGKTTTISDSTLSGNYVQGSSGLGGAVMINASGPLSVSNNLFTANRAENGNVSGGALYLSFDAARNSASAVFAGNTFQNNYCASPSGEVYGGAVANVAKSVMAFSDSTFTGNYVSGSSQSRGGAVRQSYGGSTTNPGLITFTRCTFSNNSATGFTAFGGAIEATGNLTVRDSVLFDNSTTSGAFTSAGGAITFLGDSGTRMEVTNSTLAGNTALKTATGSGGACGGGAIYFVPNSSVVSNISNCTIADNAASVTGGNVAAKGGGIFQILGTLNVANTIVATNTATSNSAPVGQDVAGAFVSGGFNLIGIGNDSTGFSNGSNGDQVGTAAAPINPKVSALGDYGGSILTMALQAGSPAINFGNPAFDASSFSPALATDARGFPRVRGGRIDIGAYEAAAAPVITSPADGARTTATPQFTGTTDPGATVTITITGGPSPVVVTTTAATDGTFSVRASALSEGTYSYTATARIGTKEAESTATAARTFAVDATPPVISDVPADITVEATSADGAAVTYSSPIAQDNVDGSVPVNCAPVSGSTFALGTTMVACSATDQAGNTANASFNVTVRDTTAPTISNVPADITTTASGPDGAIVNYGSPTASDAVSGNVPVSCSPASGSKFPIGTTTVTCTATDAANNASQATFKVTVEAPSPTPTPSPTATPTPTASPSPSPSPSATPTATPAQPINISTRVNVGTGDNVMIGGFIITGSEPKRVIVRGVGPSTEMEGALADPILELNGPDAFAPIINDDWQETQKTEIEQSKLAPKDPREAAIAVTLQPGAYTAIVRGKANTTGVGVVEVYDVSFGTPSQLSNISTRGVVAADDNVIIGGFILGGNAGDEIDVIVRAIGPSLARRGVSDALPDPALDIRDRNGNPVADNDDWQKDGRAQDVLSSQVAPEDERESALYLSLPPGEYTAIVSGKGGATGVGLVEIYHIP